MPFCFLVFGWFVLRDFNIEANVGSHFRAVIADRYAFFRTKKTRSGRRAPTVDQAKKKWKQAKGGASKVLWGNETCLNILGACYNVIFLLATLRDEKYRFWVVDGVGDRVGGDSRVAMLHCDGMHYEPIVFEEKGMFKLGDLPRVVRETWGDALSSLTSS